MLDKPLGLWYNKNVKRVATYRKKGIDTIANKTKMTKRDYFTAIMEKYPLTAEEKAFVEHELELLAKKNSADKKPTAQQVANEGIKQAILDGMEPNRLYTITELQKSISACAKLSNQRVSAIVRQMVGVTIDRTEDKRKAYFSKIAE